jgi:hypothetical protein
MSAMDILSLPSDPSSAWARNSAKLRFAHDWHLLPAGRGRNAKRSFENQHAQAELGHEEPGENP